MGTVKVYSSPAYISFYIFPFSSVQCVFYNKWNLKTYRKIYTRIFIKQYIFTAKILNYAASIRAGADKGYIWSCWLRELYWSLEVSILFVICYGKKNNVQECRPFHERYRKLHDDDVIARCRSRVCTNITWFPSFYGSNTANGSCLLSKPGRKRSSELLSCGSFAENIPFVKPSFGLPAVDNTGGDS